MLRTATKLGAQDCALPAYLFSLSRAYVGSLSLEFNEDLSVSIKSSKAAPAVVTEWNSSKAATEHIIKLLQTYKGAGDVEKEPYLKYHNPRTFEDLNKPVPNFRKFGLKAGEVPKFFDNVLTKRADESVSVKASWWDERKKVVETAVSSHSDAQPMSTIPLPEWQWAKPLPDSSFQKVTDAYFASLKPKRTLQLPTVPAQVTDSLAAFAKSIDLPESVDALQAALTASLSDKSTITEDGRPLRGFTYMTKAAAEAKLAARRAELHARFLKQWARRVLVFPEHALVPLKERDHLLASKFEDMSGKYDDLVRLTSRGTVSFGERMANTAVMDSFMMRRSKDEIKAAFPVTPQESEALELAGKLDDKSYALELLLGPAIKPEGSPDRLKSVETDELTECWFTPDRYFFKEGKKLAAKYKEEEATLADQLKELYGSASEADILKRQRTAGTPLQTLSEKTKEAEAHIALLEQEKKKHADHPYMVYALTKQQEYLRDPANIVYDEILYPELIQELYEIENRELDDKERALDEAEEEETWLLTLMAQARHVHQNISFDLPQAAIAHMDPILYKKLDYETTQGWDLWHREVEQGADCEQGEYIRDQWALENLSHHYLPLIRYRRQKYRKMLGYYPAELTALPVKTTPLA